MLQTRTNTRTGWRQWLPIPTHTAAKIYRLHPAIMIWRSTQLPRFRCGTKYYTQAQKLSNCLQQCTLRCSNLNKLLPLKPPLMEGLFTGLPPFTMQSGSHAFRTVWIREKRAQCEYNNYVREKQLRLRGHQLTRPDDKALALCNKGRGKNR